MRQHAVGLALLAVVLVAPTWAAGQGVDEDENLHGTWVIASVELMGKTIVDAEGSGSLTFLEGGKVTLKMKGKPDLECTFKVLTTKPPRQIDMTTPKGDGRQTDTVKDIYEVDGATLKLAFPFEGPEGERPTSFDSRKSGVMTFKRQKP